MDAEKNIADNARPKQWLEALMAIVCFIMPMLVAVPWFKLGQISDFSQYYVAASLMKIGCFSQIYNTATVSALQETLMPNSSHSFSLFAIPPILIWIFYPLNWLKFNLSLYMWTFVLITLMFVSCLLLCYSLGIRGIKKYWVITLAGAFGPCVMSAWLGQLTPILLFGLTGLFIGLKKKRWVLAGIAQSVFWLKPHLILPLLVFELGAGLTDTIVITSVVAVIGLLISSGLGGKNVIFAYGNLIASSLFRESSLVFGPTLYGQLLKLSNNSALINNIAIAAYIALLGLAYLMGRANKTRSLRLGILFSFLIPLSLCLSLHLFSYDLLLLIPGILLLSTYTLTGFSAGLRICLFILLLFVFILPDYLCFHYLYVLKGGFVDPFFWATLIFATGSLVIVQSLYGKPTEKENFSA